jgi:hypothetical protein
LVSAERKRQAIKIRKTKNHAKNPRLGKRIQSK